jgi:hypothetical protein|tara:strand:+ start:465 stop:1025 length:561 start_codon:yes stop_codon:yes gene_type:complete
MAHKPIGAGTSIATTGSSVKTGAINVTSSVLRITALNTDAYVAVGGDPTASLSDYVIPAGTSAGIGVTKASQRVIGITTGTTTIVTCPEGTQMPFGVGEFVTLEASGSDSNYTSILAHVAVASVDTTSGVDGFHQTRVTLTANTSGIITDFSATDARLISSVKVAAISYGTGGSIHVQPVQTTGIA